MRGRTISTTRGLCETRSKGTISKLRNVFGVIIIDPPVLLESLRTHLSFDRNAVPMPLWLPNLLQTLAHQRSLNQPTLLLRARCILLFLLFRLFRLSKFRLLLEPNLAPILALLHLLPLSTRLVLFALCRAIVPKISFSPFGVYVAR